MLFHLGTVLSITTGKLLTPRNGPDDNGIGKLYDLLSYMTGDDVYTNQLGRFADECKSFLLKQHPFLLDIDSSEVNPQNAYEWLDRQYAMYGEYLNISPMDDSSRHIVDDPVDELICMVGEDKVFIAPTNYPTH